MLIFFLIIYNLTTNLNFPIFIIFIGTECMLTPEHSIEIQNAIGADIIMQLDDVVSTITTGPRVEEAMNR